MKYGVTQNLTADFTLNTDFAQVEADEQQINLTRFSLFFPEKREFFLENRDTFTFGGVSGGGGDAPVLFYSRRIGLDAGRPVPIDGGGRLTGRIGRYSVGALNIQTDDLPDVVRAPRTSRWCALRRDILRESTIGAMATRRSVGQGGTGPNTAYGVDGAFNFFNDLAVNTYWARTETDGVRGGDTSYRAQLNFPGDRYGVQLERLRVGEPSTRKSASSGGRHPAHARRVPLQPAPALDAVGPPLHLGRLGRLLREPAPAGWTRAINRRSSPSSS